MSKGELHLCGENLSHAEDFSPILNQCTTDIGLSLLSLITEGPPAAIAGLALTIGLGCYILSMIKKGLDAATKKSHKAPPYTQSSAQQARNNNQNKSSPGSVTGAPDTQPAPLELEFTEHSKQKHAWKPTKNPHWVSATVRGTSYSLNQKFASIGLCHLIEGAKKASAAQQRKTTLYPCPSRNLLLEKMTDLKKNPKKAAKKVRKNVSHALALLDSLPIKSDAVLRNPERREEAYFPAPLNNGEQMWLSGYNSLKAPPRFIHTASCMWGASMQGNSHTLIKHELPETLDSVINQIRHPKAKNLNLYEHTFLNMLRKILKLTSRTNIQKLVIHLPYIDYMTFGVELLISASGVDKTTPEQQITLKALGNLIFASLKKREAYSKQIITHCRKHGFQGEIDIISPFTPLVTDKDLEAHLSARGEAEKPRESAAVNIAKFFIGHISGENFNLSNLVVDYNHDNSEKTSTPHAPSSDQKKLTEANFVTGVINRLHTSSKKQNASLLEKAWGDYFTQETLNTETPITTINQLLRASNGLMLEYTGRHGRTISILPTSEKQIQLMHQRHCKGQEIAAFVTPDDVFETPNSQNPLPPFYTKSTPMGELFFQKFRGGHQPQSTLGTFSEPAPT